MQHGQLIRIFQKHLRTFSVSVMVGSAGQMWRPPRPHLHGVKVKLQWLLSPDISILTLPRIPACNLLLRTCSLAKKAHVAKYLALLFTVSFTHTHAHSRTHTHTFWVWICLSAQRSSPALLAAWLTHSSPVGTIMSRPSPFGPTWQREITSKPAWIFSPVPSSPFLSSESG